MLVHITPMLISLGVSIQFVGDHTQLFQLAFKQAYLNQIDLKFTLVIGFG